MTRTTPAILLSTSILAIAASCGPTSEPAPAPDTVAESREVQQNEDAIIAEPVEVGPVAVEPAHGVQQADLRVKPEPLVSREEAERAAAQAPTRPASPNRVDPTPSAGGAGLWRADGRPVWWVDQSGWRDGRYSICAEAMGEDVRTARRNAIDAARREAKSALGGTIRDERVETAIVRSLASDATGKNRYVGYVRMTALRGE
jgi:hypothetical protein